MRRSILSASLLLAACAAEPLPPVCDAACRDQAVPDHCVSTADYFETYSWPIVFSTCVECHVAGGESDGTRFVLKPETIPDFLSQNMAIVAEAANLREGGVPLMVLKAAGRVDHGGGTVVEPGSLEVATIQETLARLAEPVECPGEEATPSPMWEGVELYDAYWTLRKAAIQLVGRPPTADEIAAIDAGGFDALDPILDTMMREPAWEERIREIWGDVLLTDGWRANSITGTSYRIVDGSVQPVGVVHWGGPDWDWRSWPAGEGIRLVEALAREPLEFVVRAVMEDAPISEILTSRHRLLNAYSARFYGVDYRGFPPGTPFAEIPDPTGYEPTAVPLVNEEEGSGEYAGILSTSAWLLRYPSSPTNFNRKRARFTLKAFLDYDIMKTAPRIDASAVDLEAYPTRNNEQCTGCHSLLDPLAGAYKNWDECGWDARAFYRVPGAPDDSRGDRKYTVCDTESGWVVPEHMFPPGVGLGAKNELDPADSLRALEALGDHIVTQRSFARSVVSTFWVGMLSRPLRAAPTDPAAPGYVALDAGYSAEQAEINRLTDRLESDGLRVSGMLKEIVRSPFFRAKDAEVEGRLELLPAGGGTLVIPEILDRKVEAITGVRWRRHGWAIPRDSGYQQLGRHDGSTDAFLLQRESMKTLYGGIDGTFDGVKVRQRLPSTITAAIVTQLALAVSCEATARDFSLAPEARRLFPLVEVDLLPSGDPDAADQAPILSTVRALHEAFLGGRLAVDDPEIRAAYDLLVAAHEAGLADLASGAESASLPRPCAADLDLSTATATPGGILTDPQYVVRAWQSLLAYYLMDPEFVFEP